MSAATIGHLRWGPSAHLGVLLEDIERLAARIDGAVRLGSVAPQLWDLAVIASCRLDGSAMTATPTPGDTTSLVADDAAPMEVMRREYAGVATALRADDLGALLRRDPLRALPALHRILTAGLVAPSASGQLRRTVQAVHDGNEGRIVFLPVEPARIAVDLPTLQDLVAADSLHPVVVAGLLQFEILRLHPFESANGRLARVAARLVLRDAGLDPAGMAVAEVAMSGRRVGNYDAVAAALRSGDQTTWLETWAEDVAAGLRLALGALGLAPDQVPVAIVADLSPHFTLADLAAAVHPDADDAPLDMDDVRRLAARLADAGFATIDSGSRGLRMTRGAPSAPGWYDPDRGIVGADDTPIHRQQG